MNFDQNVAFIHDTVIVEFSAEIGHMTYIWHFSHIENDVTIGDNCSLGQNVYVGKNVTIGNGCRIQNNVYIPSGVTIGNDVFIGPGATFTNIKRPDARINQHDHYLKTLVCDGVVIGAGAIILPGIVLEENSFIGAGAVVTKDVNSHVTVVGNPAREFPFRR